MYKPRNFQNIPKHDISITGLKWLLDHRKITETKNSESVQIGFTTRVYPHLHDESIQKPTFKLYDYLTISGFNQKDTTDSINIVLNDNHATVEQENSEMNNFFYENNKKYENFVDSWENEEFRQKKWKLHINKLDQESWNFIDNHFTVDKNGIIEYNKNCFIVLNKENNFVTGKKENYTNNIPDISIVGNDASIVQWIHTSFSKIASKKNRKEIRIEKKPSNTNNFINTSEDKNNENEKSNSSNDDSNKEIDEELDEELDKELDEELDEIAGIETLV